MSTDNTHHADDTVQPALPLAAVAAAVTGCLASPVSRVAPVAGSVGNQDFLVDTEAGAFVLKAGPGDRLVAEAWACERARTAGVSAPEVVAVQAVPECLPLPFLLMRRFAGEEVDGTSAALVEAGRQLRLVHGVELRGYGGLAVDGGDAAGSCPSWAAFLGQVTSGLTGLVTARVVTEELAAAAAATVAGCEDLRYEQPAVLVHGDLKLRHIFADQGRYVGIIDWGDACAGDPRFDLGRMSMAGETALIAFLRGYERDLTADLRRALTAYRLVWNLDALHYEHAAGGDWFATYRQGVQEAVTELGLG